MKTKTKRRTKAQIKASREINEFLQYEDFDKLTLYLAAKRAHAILSAGIKKALNLKEWPKFDQHPNNTLLASCIAKLLIDEVAKLRADKEELEKNYDRIWRQST